MNRNFASFIKKLPSFFILIMFFIVMMQAVKNSELIESNDALNERVVSLSSTKEQLLSSLNTLTLQTKEASKSIKLLERRLAGAEIEGRRLNEEIKKIMKDELCETKQNL